MKRAASLLAVLAVGGAAVVALHRRQQAKAANERDLLESDILADLDEAAAEITRINSEIANA